MNEIIDNDLKSIRIKETRPDGTQSVMYISYNDYCREYIINRRIGERRYNKTETLYGYMYTRIVITDYETNKKTERLFKFPKTEEEAEHLDWQQFDLKHEQEKKQWKRRELRKKFARFMLKLYPPSSQSKPSSYTRWEAKCYHFGSDTRMLDVCDNDVEAAANILSLHNGKMIRFDPSKDGGYYAWYKNGKRYKIKKRY